jgi:hypothetical protein
MTKDVEEYSGTFVALSTAWPDHKNWKGVDTIPGVANQPGIYWESYFDLSGYNLDDLTVIPTLMELQDAGPYFFTNPAGPPTPDNTLWMVDVLSMERLDATEVFTDLVGMNYPGSPGSKLNFEQLPMVNARFTTARSTIGDSSLQTVATAGSLGSGEPTTVQKLWCYRFILIGQGVAGLAGGETLLVPSTRFVLAAQIVQEAELAHMMRLKRSYELSTQ